MYNRPEVAHVHELVQGDIFGLLVLYVAYSTVGERVPLDLEFAKDTLDLSHDLFDDVGNSCQLKIVNMLRHDCGEATFVVPHAEFMVNLARDKTALVSHFAKLDGEGTRGVA
jgi:hypothetical protein